MNPRMSIVNLIGLLLVLAGAVVAALAVLIADKMFPEHENARVWLKIGGSAVTVLGLLLFLDILM